MPRFLDNLEWYGVVGQKFAVGSYAVFSYAPEGNLVSFTVVIPTNNDQNTVTQNADLMRWLRTMGFTSKSNFWPLAWGSAFYNGFMCPLQGVYVQSSTNILFSFLSTALEGSGAVEDFQLGSPDSFYIITL